MSSSVGPWVFNKQTAFSCKVSKKLAHLTIIQGFTRVQTSSVTSNLTGPGLGLSYHKNNVSRLLMDY